MKDSVKGIAKYFTVLTDHGRLYNHTPESNGMDVHGGDQGRDTEAPHTE